MYVWRRLIIVTMDKTIYGHVSPWGYGLVLMESKTIDLSFNKVYYDLIVKTEGIWIGTSWLETPE